MPTQFRDIILPNLTGMFDAQSTPDQIGFGNFRLRKNWSIRGTKKTCRRGGWRRHEAETEPYNNQDLHDQLLGSLAYYETFTGFFNFPGGVCDYSYPYFYPSQPVDGYSIQNMATEPVCGYYPSYPQYAEGMQEEGCFVERFQIGYPYQIEFPNYGQCNSGPPDYYSGSYFYPDCAELVDGYSIPGYGYGSPSPVYCDPMAYTSEYCGNGLYYSAGCREAITLLHEVNGSQGRRLIAATMSRIYEYNHSTGDWVLLADTLGNAAYSSEQCGCNDVRFMAASMGDFTIFTNGFDEPLLRQVGGLHKGCNIWAANPIDDLRVLDIQAAGGVVAWKGFMILFDVTASGKREGGRIIWSDFENPLSWIPSDTSVAGSSVVAVGETFLNAAEIGNFLYLYSDRGIWRVTLVGGELLFSFDKIYGGTSALKYKYSLVNTGSEHFYMGVDKVYVVTQFDQRPIEVDWVVKASHAIYHGMEEDDATFSSINKQKCNQAVGGWSEEFKEVWFSWPTGDNTCPDMSLVLNVQYRAADLVDHGFTAFLSMRPDVQPTVGEWLNDLQICSWDDLQSDMVKEGFPCESEPVSGGPLYLVNETEDENLPVDPNSLCALLAGKTEDDFCRQCAAEVKYLMSSAEDFTIKQYEDEVYLREVYSDTYGSYCAQSCDGGFYFCEGYDTVLQSGSDNYRSDFEKLIRRINVEVQPVAQTVPSTLECYVGYSGQAVCDTWFKLEDQLMKCRDSRTQSQRDAQILRDDLILQYPTYWRGKYISWRLKIKGTGGGACFGSLTTTVRISEGAFTR